MVLFAAAAEANTLYVSCGEELVRASGVYKPLRLMCHHASESSAHPGFILPCRVFPGTNPFTSICMGFGCGSYQSLVRIHIH